MAVVELGSISDFFKNNSKALSKGENAYHSQHLKKIKIDNTSEIIYADAEVLASMKKKTYNVSIEYKINEKKVTKATCQCPVGQVTCHHMALVLVYLNKNLSKTDVPCSWIKKSKKSDTSDVVQAVDDDRFRSCKIENLQNINLKHKTKIKKSNLMCGFSFLFADEPKNEENNVFNELLLESILFSKDFQCSENKLSFLQNIFNLNFDKIKNVANATKGQTENILWCNIHRFRLTASNFGLILKAIKNEKYPPSLFRTLLGSYNLDGVKAIQWGKQKESTAIEKLEKDYGCTIHKTGLWLSDCGILAASPDGIMCSTDGNVEFVIEIKCPFKYRNSDLFKVFKNDVNNKYIVVVHDNNEVVYNDQHVYYHQIQAQMWFTNCSFAVLCVWSTVNSIVVKIPKDNDWGSNLSLLRNFFFEQYLPRILNEVEVKK